MPSGAQQSFPKSLQTSCRQSDSTTCLSPFEGGGGGGGVLSQHWKSALAGQFTADETPSPSTTSYPGRRHERCAGPYPSGAQQSFMRSPHISCRHLRAGAGGEGGRGGVGGESRQHAKIAECGQPFRGLPADEKATPSTASYSGSVQERCVGPRPSGAQQSPPMSPQMS